MTCDDFPINCKENRAKRDLKRKLDTESVEASRAKMSSNNNDVITNKVPKQDIEGTKRDTHANNQSPLVHPYDQNSSVIEDDRKSLPVYSTKKKKQLEIETELRILKSLIPNIANKQQINELEIIDACVNYIEALQEQLNIQNTQDPQCNLVNNKGRMSTITSLVNAITDQSLENDGRNVHVDEGDEDYLTSESSDDDQNEDELGQDNNNNKETVDAKKIDESTVTTVDIESIVTSNVKMSH